MELLLDAHLRATEWRRRTAHRHLAGRAGSRPTGTRREHLREFDIVLRGPQARLFEGTDDA